MIATKKTRRARSPQPRVAVDQFIERRRAVGLSQSRLAILARVNNNTLSRIELGKLPLTVPMAKRLDLILRAFEQSLSKAEAALRAS
jgi:transcriptional regulator with XRE-family HTH domain